MRRDDTANLIEALHLELAPLRTDMEVVKEQVKQIAQVQSQMYTKEVIDSKLENIESDIKRITENHAALWGRIAAGLSAIYILLNIIPTLIKAFGH
jgi:hypothetical protein